MMTQNSKKNYSRESDATHPGNQYSKVNTCFSAVKYLYFAILKLLSIKGTGMSKKEAGRPKMGSLEKALAKASRAYQHLQDVNAKTESDYSAERIQFAETESAPMGRPAVKVDRSKGHRNQFHAEMMINRERALESWEFALSEYRKVEADMGVDAIPEADVYTYQKHTKVGRPSADKTDKLRKYIRREARRIEDLQAEIDAGAIEEKPARGRPRKTREEKIKAYSARIQEAQDEIDTLITAMPEHDRIKHQINEFRVESREITVFLKFELSRGEAESRQAELKDRIDELSNTTDKDTPELKEIRAESRHIAVFLNTRLERESAEVRQAEIKKQLGELLNKHKDSIKSVKHIIPPSEGGLTDLASENVEIHIETEAERADRIKQESYDRKYAEIEERNQRLKATIARLKEQKALEEELRALGGDPDQLDPIEKTG